ncbi:MAG: OsmC family protein [Chloroflexota bacterium]
MFVSGGKRVATRHWGITTDTEQNGRGGSEDSVPSSFALFVVSLAACAGLHVQRCCHRPGIPSQGIRLVQWTAPDPNTNLATKGETSVNLPDSFPEEYRKAAVRAAEE